MRIQCKGSLTRNIWQDTVLAGKYTRLAMKIGRGDVSFCTEITKRD